MFPIIVLSALIVFALTSFLIVRRLFENPEEKLGKTVERYLKILRSSKSKPVDRHFAAQEIHELCLSEKLNLDQMKDCLSALEVAIVSHLHTGEIPVLEKAGFLLKEKLLNKIESLDK